MLGQNKLDLSAVGEKAFSSKALCFDFTVRSSSKDSPDCPYFWLPCRNFYVKFGCGVCFQDDMRCSWLPSWVKSCKDSIFAILGKDGKLYVGKK